MAFSDTKWGGFAKIIVDTSAMTVGDTVRVKSVTTGTNYDKQVVTVGTPLIWETDIYKDYVKICMVQDIGGTPTEIGGLYRKLDYGETAYINALDKSTLQGMQGILNAHNELAVYNIGDEIKIKINDGTVKDWIMQVGRIDGANHTIDLVSKYGYEAVYWYTSGSTVAGVYYSDATDAQSARKRCQAFYNAIIESDRQFIKSTRRSCRSAQSTNAWKQFDDHVWLPNAYEISSGVGSNYQDSNVPKTQFPIFTTQASRVKTDINGTARTWWTCDGYVANDKIAFVVAPNGTTGYYSDGGYTSHLVPCFRLTADS